MNAFDLAAITGVMVELRTCLDQIAGLCRLPPDPGVDVGLLRERLEDLQERLGRIVEGVQDRACRRWRYDSHRPRHDAPPWIHPKRHGLPLSTEVDPGAKVVRFGVNGKPIAETRAAGPRRG